jgi:hypothetical protein
MTNQFNWTRAKAYRQCPLSIKDEVKHRNNDMAANWLKTHDRKKKKRFRKHKRDNYARKHFGKYKGKAGPKTVVVGKNGDPCPRCGCLTEIRQHKHVGPKQLRQPFYYSRWYYCMNPSCRTNQIMPEQFKVFPSAGHVTQIAHRIEAIERQLGQKVSGSFE